MAVIPEIMNFLNINNYTKRITKINNRIIYNMKSLRCNNSNNNSKKSYFT